MSDAVVWMVTIAVGVLSVLAVAVLVLAILYAAHTVREVVAEAGAAGAKRQWVVLLGWLNIIVAALLIIALVAFLISIIMALAQAPQDMAKDMASFAA
jgi:hypothetical protein